MHSVNIIEDSQLPCTGGPHEQGVVLALLMLLDCGGHTGSWFPLSSSKYLLNESSLLGIALYWG